MCVYICSGVYAFKEKEGEEGRKAEGEGRSHHVHRGEEKNEGEGGVSALFVCAECVCVYVRARWT